MLLSASGYVALEEAEKNFPHPLLSSLMLFVCTEQAGEVVEHFSKKKRAIGAVFLENAAQYPLMKEMNSESSPSGFPQLM